MATATTQNATRRMTATVTSASGPNSDKQFGFARDGSGKDWFFHFDNVEGPTMPQEGDRISFIPNIRGIPGKSDRASSVRIVTRGSER